MKIRDRCIDYHRVIEQSENTKKVFPKVLSFIKIKILKNYLEKIKQVLF